MITENPVSDCLAEARDNGTLRYYRIHPNWWDGTNSHWVRSYPEVRVGEPGDLCDYKCSTGLMLYGISKTNWIVGIKRRSDGAQFRTRPRWLVRWNGEPTVEILQAGVFDTAIDATDIQVRKVGDRYICQWTGIFQYANLSAVFDEGGRFSVRHRVSVLARNNVGLQSIRPRFSALAQKDVTYQYYGTVWEVQTNSVDFVRDVIKSDQQVGTRFFAFSNNDRFFFCEYFRASAFERHPEPLQIQYDDVEHEYTTISGDLTGDLALSRGSTYYLTANCNLGSYNVTVTGASGRVTLKTSGNVGFIVNSTGTFVVDNVDFTSRNDDSRGDSIAGSSGSPDPSDQTSYWINFATNSSCTISVDQFTVNYFQFGAASVFGGNGNRSGLSVSITNGTFSNCNTPSTAASRSSYIGQAFDSALLLLSLTITNVNVDSTCTVNKTNGHFVNVSPAVNSQTFSFVDVWSNPGGTTAFQRAIYMDCGKTTTINVTNCFLRMSGIATFAIYGYTASANVTFNLNRNILTNPGGTTGNCIYMYQSGSNTFTANIYDNQFYGTTGSGYALTKSGTIGGGRGNNNFYGNANNCYEALKVSETTVDPQFGNLPSGAVIADGSFLVDGYAVLNAVLEKGGSDTYTALGVDASTRSATGKKYSSSDNITPSLQYELKSFGGVSAMMPILVAMMMSGV